MSDPLHKAPLSERELFERMAKTCNGFSHEQVMGAAVNIVINALRQGNQSQKAALAALDEITAKARSSLASHYDSMGKRRNVFPFHQTIEMPMFDARPNGKGH